MFKDKLIDLLNKISSTYKHTKKSSEDKLTDLLAENPEEEDEKREFRPLFNAREEFAVWIREQFPQLKTYALNRESYDDLTERKKEVMKGARSAYEHALLTAHGCARTSFEVAFARLSGDKSRLKCYKSVPLDRQNGSLKIFYMTEEDENIEENSKNFFAKYLEGFVVTIERSSLNLPSSNGRHYGTKSKIGG